VQEDRGRDRRPPLGTTELEAVATDREAGGLEEEIAGRPAGEPGAAPADGA
jgi:hypothetical protein